MAKAKPKPKRRTMTDVMIRRFAQEIAADLFTNGIGEKAGNLSLISDDGRDLGGWCEKAMADRLERHLHGENPAKERKAKVSR